ncbi:MAG: YggS family pyridoxal phosphate-dependent enzyme [bacterium]|nr:YggS family pyridoxal phosphate-dependent enzyme [bacterium]
MWYHKLNIKALEMSNIKENLDYLKKKVKENCSAKEITIVAVTKFIEIDKIEEIVKFGIKDIGENKVQEAERKFPLLQKYNIKYHMIGHLQTNKVKKAVKLFDLIHSVDSYRLALEIDKEAKKLNKIQNILLQVNTSREESNYGILAEQTIQLVKELALLSNITLKGLMTIAPFVCEEIVLRDCFKNLKNLQDEISKQAIKGVQLKYLSMGMSNDYVIALQEGANMIRIGSAIFR